MVYISYIDTYMNECITLYIIDYMRYVVNIIEYNFIFDFFELSYKARFITDLGSPVESSSFVLLITHFVIFHISNCSKLNVLIYKVYFRVYGLQVLY